jgi:hypothetical protein
VGRHVAHRRHRPSSLSGSTVCHRCQRNGGDFSDTGDIGVEVAYRLASE